MNKDEQLLLDFLNRNLPAMAPTFDEGIGIASERYFYARIIEWVTKKYQIKSVLEAPVDGLMGIPGMNSVYFARAGAKVTVSSPSNELLTNAKKFWRKLGLEKMVTFVHDPDFAFPFRANSFDLVWNYCTYEHFRDNSLLPIMKSISKKIVMIVTQNKYNYGYPIHRYYHRKNHMAWDHGYPELMDLFRLKKAFRKQGLKIIKSGCVDVPPFFDTFDMHTRGLGKKLMRKGQEARWTWSALQEGDLEVLSQNKLIKFLDIFQKTLFFPLNFLFAHHFYLLGSKNFVGE